MKKVLFVATVVQKHINVFHLPFLKMFQEEGYRTYVAASNDTDMENVSIPYCDEYTEIAFRRNPLHPGNFAAYRKLRRLIQSHDFDIIHCHTPVGGLLGRLAARGARKNGTRVFYTAHGFHFYKGAPLKNWLFYYPAEKLCSYFTDVLITINHEDYALAKKKMKAKRVEYVPGVGFDLNKFDSLQVEYEAKRCEIGVPKDEILITSVGELSVRKNHRVVLRAIAKINNKKIHYAIVGIGGLLPELQALAKEYGILDRVHFLGYRGDVAEIYKVTDICCLPSIHEGLPVALIEGMACGLPAVCSRIRGNTDLIEDEDGGIFFEPDNVDGCAHAIEHLLSCDMTRMGNHNKERVQNYSLDKIITKMKTLYES